MFKYKTLLLLSCFYIVSCSILPKSRISPKILDQILIGGAHKDEVSQIIGCNYQLSFKPNGEYSWIIPVNKRKKEDLIISFNRKDIVNDITLPKSWNNYIVEYPSDMTPYLVPKEIYVSPEDMLESFIDDDEIPIEIEGESKYEEHTIVNDKIEVKEGIKIQKPEPLEIEIKESEESEVEEIKDSEEGKDIEEKMKQEVEDIKEEAEEEKIDDVSSEIKSETVIEEKPIIPETEQPEMIESKPEVKKETIEMKEHKFLDMLDALDIKD